MGIRSAVIVATSAALILGTGLAASGSQGSGLEQSSVVVNGGFERPDVGRDANFYAGDTFGHWTVITGSVDLVGFYWHAAQGMQSVDMDGFERGAISQEIPTIAGHRYVLYFALSGNPDLGCDDEGHLKHLRVIWDGVEVGHYTFDTTGRTHEHIGWVQKGLLLRASAAATTLEFESLDEGCAGPVIDNVRLIPA